MEQFRQIGEALGGLKFVMCIADEITQNLKFEEKNGKWKVLEHPFREIHKIFGEEEAYIRHCMETKDWWAKAIALWHNTIVTSSLIICHRYDTVRKEDRFLYNKIHEKKVEGITMYEKKLIDLLLRNLERSESLVGRLLPSSTLVGSKDYQVRRKKGNASQYKEITWLGESFVIRHFSCDIEALEPEIIELLSLSHPNIMDSLFGFTDEEKKECFLIHGPRKRIPFLLHVAIDLMLQIARGMEYLHSKKVYHGELNPSSILVKPRGTSPEGYLHAKVTGFGLTSVKDLNQKGNTNQNGTPPFIWYSPEKSDVYSFGMVFFELLTGKVPFEDSHIQGKKMSRNIREGERPLFPLNSPKYVINLT
ncbi:hypothetical protein GYH30_017536 [Glycine max]|uniref:Protein kinase domain-containing protein n=1 Tax=Glycine max TaxID=3847 RepID=K7KZW6_SOYBN|nr:hypothetical protein GYH30_017536 [Glycine max]